MGPIGVWIADALDDGQFASVIQRFEPGEVLVKPHVIIDLENLLLCQADLRSRSVVMVIAVRH